MSGFGYRCPSAAADASRQLLEPGALAMGGGTDLLPRLRSGVSEAAAVVDLRALGLDGIDRAGDGLAIGATATVADLARADGIPAVLAEAARSVAAPQLREMGTVAGNLCQQVRCWYFRHPDLRCWLGGGDTCYAQIGDHRKHGLEPGDCISVAPSDLAAALLVLDAHLDTNRRRRLPLAALYRPPDESDRSTLTLEPGEFLTAVSIPRMPDASAYARTGERRAWSFALVAVAAARFGGQLRLAAIGVSNLPRLLDPADPLAGLPGLEMTRWKRRLLAGLVEDALSRVDG